MALNTRTIWNGAISFGLVNIPVGLHTVTSDSDLDFDLIDKRTMDLVGYKRINKKTGEEMQKENIVKGIEYEKGRYVVLSDEEIKIALPKSTQTIEIESFVSADDIPLLYFERPYYLAPNGPSMKAYVLLRETLLKTGRVGVARVVMHTKQHLAAIIPTKSVLILILLRWASQIRSSDELVIQDLGGLGINEREFDMAAQLVESMSEPWSPEKFHDSFNDKVMALVTEKVKVGTTEALARTEDEPVLETENVIDFTELLKRSLHKEMNNVV